jgi:transposase
MMESTAQYWRPVWLELEPRICLHLAQAFSNRAPRGRKHDFKDAERLVRRLIAQELLDEQIGKLNSLIAVAMNPHQNTVIRLAEVPGLGIDSAQQIIAEVGVTASTSPSAAEFTSWVGTCPGKSAKRRRKLQQPFGERQQVHAPCAQPIRRLGHRTSPMPPGLEDSS